MDWPQQLGMLSGNGGSKPQKAVQQIRQIQCAAVCNGAWMWLRWLYWSHPLMYAYNIVVAWYACSMRAIQWVVTTAVAPNDAATRAARLRLWIQVGEQLLKLSSFNIAMSVAAALQHTLVQALPEMQTLSPEDQRYQKELCQVRWLWR
jgi:hypothetical protein